MTLQESLGSVLPGRLLRIHEVILLRDLIDSVKPGEEIVRYFSPWYILLTTAHPNNKKSRASLNMFIRSASVQSHLSALDSQLRYRDPRPSHVAILSSDFSTATRDFPLSLTHGPLKDTLLVPVVDSFGWILSGSIVIHSVSH